ncbi:MAG: hypothetical protein KatS3mg005_4153 [Bryobacteraceae bacterium]|nr:MAG: hypothetical protein KatS3mg005_4153 [Bryobacteraceae bacterium]
MTIALHYPQFRPSSFHREALANLLRVTRSPGYQPGAYPVPPSPNAQLGSLARLDVRLSLPVGSYVLGFSGNCSASAGFRVQIVDLRNNAAFFNTPVNWRNICPQGNTLGITLPVHYLVRPRLVIEPAVLSVQLENLATSPNTIELVIFTAEPRP